MGNWYKAPVGVGAGVMGIGYWCFAATVFLTVFQGRLVRVPKPSGHLWKFLATGAAGLTVGTVQGVIQVQPANADWLYRAGHAGEWIDPIAHAHINLVTGLTMLVAGALFYLAPLLGGKAPSRRAADACFYALLAGSLAFYGSAMYLGFHEGGLVVRRGLTPGEAERATALHPFLLMGAGIAMMAAFWFLLWLVARAYRAARGPARGFVLAGCGALAVGNAAGADPGLPGRSRPARRGRRRRRGDREPARPAEHARRAPRHARRAHARASRPAGRDPGAARRAGCAPRRRDRRRDLLRSRHRDLHRRGAQRVGGRHVPTRGCEARALGRPLVDPGRARRADRVRRLRGQRLADDGAAATGGGQDSCGGSRHLHGAHPETSPQPQADCPRRVRAADGPARLPGVGWLFAGFP